MDDFYSNEALKETEFVFAVPLVEETAARDNEDLNNTLHELVKQRDNEDLNNILHELVKQVAIIAVEVAKLNVPGGIRKPKKPHHRSKTAASPSVQEQRLRALDFKKTLSQAQPKKPQHPSNTTIPPTPKTREPIPVEVQRFRALDFKKSLFYH